MSWALLRGRSARPPCPIWSASWSTAPGSCSRRRGSKASSIRDARRGSLAASSTRRPRRRRSTARHDRRRAAVSSAAMPSNPPPAASVSEPPTAGRRGARPGVPHKPLGQGSVACWTSGGRRVCHGVVTRDGVRYRARAVTVKRGMTEATARRLAAEHLRALLRGLDANRPPDPARDRTTLAAWAPQWQELKKPELTAGSRERYANLLE